MAHDASLEFLREVYKEVIQFPPVIHNNITNKHCLLTMGEGAMDYGSNGTLMGNPFIIEEVDFSIFLEGPSLAFLAVLPSL